ncbi:unnamed protein product [Cylindrotheca closterium]|uniref:C2 domain-containing protein n=1 Tax=Cylindrotheca closterium TaxID=2856 RepID=A0AAD2FGJ0_9STRA|nr:unnamed protein product [Cylindrotheca closterium]
MTMESTPSKVATGSSSTSILCEIIGAQNLTVPTAPKEALHTFCTVQFNRKLVHTTRPEAGRNPIWTVTSKSLFLLPESKVETLSNPLLIEVYAVRNFAPNNSASSFFADRTDRIFLGSVEISRTSILSQCNGQRIELKIQKNRKDNVGTLAVRFRISQESDQQILNLLKSSKDGSQLKKEFLDQILHGQEKEQRSPSNNEKSKSKLLPIANLVTEKSDSSLAQNNFFSLVNNMFTASTVYDTKSYRELRRIKPYPNPKSPNETEFLSATDIKKQTYGPSHSWVEAGSGKLGRLYVEVLACHDLPNMDMGEAVGDYTDPFVCLVYEDTVATTDVIDDELSPHWLPWTQRAFSFGTMHPASILYLGVFDFDVGSDHDPIGRVAVNLSNLQHNTEYTLEYALYKSSNVTDRTANGSITLRLRMECYDEKAALMEVLAPRPRININVRMQKTFRVVRYTCFGEYDNEESFDLTVTRSYINEILCYKRKLYYAIRDSFFSLVFWRGQVDIAGDGTTKVPLYSFLFFVGACHLIENPHLVVPFTLLSISFIMMASHTQRIQHPSPWKRCQSIWHFVDILLGDLTKSPANAADPKSNLASGVSVKAFERHQEAEAYEKSLQDRVELDVLREQKRFELQQELENYGNENISTAVNNAGMLLPPDLQARLTRWQGIIGRICTWIRCIRIVTLWEESILSFWITAAFFVSGVVSMILPWKFILLWSARITVWGFFGPHMKVIDTFFQLEEESQKVLIRNIDRLFQEARLRREEAVKVQAIKVLAFGKYSVLVPSYNVARHFDQPLAPSFAKQSPESHSLHVAQMIPGQQLYGTMIPRPETEAALYSEAEQRILKHREASSLIPNTPSSDITPTTEPDSSEDGTNAQERGASRRPTLLHQEAIEVVAVVSDGEDEALATISNEEDNLSAAALRIRTVETNVTSFASSSYYDSSSYDNSTGSSEDEDDQNDDRKGIEIVPKASTYAEDEGLEIVATGRLQSMEPDELLLLRSKSLDSIIFHRRESQDIARDGSEEGEGLDASEMRRVSSEVGYSTSASISASKRRRPTLTVEVDENPLQ